MYSQATDQQKIDALADSILPDLADWIQDPILIEKYKTWKKEKGAPPSTVADAFDGCCMNPSPF